MSANGHHAEPEPMLRLTITPEPTDEEAAAIAAALSIISVVSEASVVNDTGPEPGSRISPWIVTGRLAAHHAAPRARQRRWSRTLAWLGGA